MNRTERRPGPYDTFKMKRNHAANPNIPSTYETFSDNLTFGKNSDEIKNEEFDFRPLYDEDGNRIHQTQKLPQYNPTHTSDEKLIWHKKAEKTSKNDIPLVYQNQANSNPTKNIARPQNQNKPDGEKQRINEYSTCKTKTNFQIYTDDNDPSDQSNKNT